MKLLLKPTPGSRRKGVVATTCISLASVVGVLLVALSAGPDARRRGRQMGEGSFLGAKVAESAVQLATSKLWGDYRLACKQEGPSGLSFEAFLDREGIMRPSDEPDSVGFDYLPKIGVYQDRNGSYPLGGGFVLRLHVIRRNTPEGLEVEISSSASMGQGMAEREASQVYDSAGHSKEE